MVVKSQLWPPLNRKYFENWPLPNLLCWKKQVQLQTDFFIKKIYFIRNLQRCFFKIANIYIYWLHPYINFNTVRLIFTNIGTFGNENGNNHKNTCVVSNDFINIHSFKCYQWNLISDYIVTQIGYRFVMLCSWGTVV